MDENNLDSLLDELSAMDGELNENIDIDSGVDVDADDMDDISLDELDHLDGMDLGDLDFDDIDFDDVDITNLDAGANPVIKKKPQVKEPEDMNLDALIEKANQESVKPEPQKEEPAEPMDNTDVFGEADLQMQEDTALPEGVFDDALFGSMDMGMPEQPEQSEKSEKEKNPYTADEDSLDALLQSSMAESLLSGDLADIEDIGEKPEKTAKKSKQPRKKAEKKKKTEMDADETDHKKKTISEILFGEPDEDDIEEEALFKEKKAKKEAEKKKKQAEREAKKEEKDAARQEMLTAKQAKDKAKQKEKADKKRQKDEAYAAELEAEKDQKKVSTPTVIVVFVLFFALAAGVVLGTNQFNYSQVIKKATNYFERQRYRLAYDEVSGVDVKEKDQDLKDRIYTVMYVERLYESYENNMKLGRSDKALDALLRGIEKYDEHYDEAVELDIVKDIDSCRDKIINALWNTYGITEDTAYQILAMEGQEYTKTLSELGAKAAETETPTDAQGK
ncbi:hypothetical protein KQI72_04670 [Eubacterium sp. MSJ-21]|nr:hypothetical protein [Eubacterium sp. MSJ-21]